MWQSPISASTSPFQVYPPFLAKKFIPPSPSDSTFGRSYLPPLLIIVGFQLSSLSHTLQFLLELRGLKIWDFESVSKCSVILLSLLSGELFCLPAWVTQLAFQSGQVKLQTLKDLGYLGTDSLTLNKYPTLNVEKTIIFTIKIAILDNFCLFSVDKFPI